MDIYKGFAGLYDSFMANVPYNDWAFFLDAILKDAHMVNFEKNLPYGKLILDLACGTGSMTVRLALMGYDMIGVDKSYDMLSFALQKSYEANVKCLFLEQDMINLDLYGTVDGVICVLDGLNYILSDDELFEVFKRVRLFLNPGGIFVFDLNTEYKFKEILGDKSFEANYDDDYYIWDNFYDSSSKINEYHMLFYSKHEKEPFSEIHYQKAHDLGQVISMLLNAGFENIKLTDGYTNNPLTPKSERVLVHCNATTLKNLSLQ